VTRSCPWCREPLAVARQGGDRCPACDRPLLDDAGRELRAIDLRYEEVEAELWRRFGKLIMVGAPVVALVVLALPTLHVGAVAAAPLLAVIHLVVARLYLVRNARRFLGPVRRRFVRWLGRLGYLWVGVPGYAMAAAPVVGVIPGLGTYLGLTTATWAYVRWSLAEEYHREPLAGWEKWLLGLLIAASLAAAVATALMLGGIGLSVALLTQWLAAD
jgi:hypothetical protein